MLYRLVVVGPSTGTVDCAAVPIECWLVLIVAPRGGDDLRERGGRFVSPASRMRRDGGRLRGGAGPRCVGAKSRNAWWPNESTPMYSDRDDGGSHLRDGATDLLVGGGRLTGAYSQLH